MQKARLRLVALVIAFYRRFLRPLYPRECLFQVSCSEHVLRASQHGLRAAWRAFFERLATCRADYGVGQRDGQFFAISQAGQWIPAAELIPSVQAELQDAVRFAP